MALDIPTFEGELTDVLADLCPRSHIPGAVAGVWHDGREAIACFGVTSVADPLPG